MDKYQPEIVSALRAAGYKTRAAPTIPKERWDEYRMSKAEKSEADLFVIGPKIGYLIEIKTGTNGVLSFARDFQKGQWEWAIRHTEAGFSVWYAIMFDGIPKELAPKGLRKPRELLMLPFSHLRAFREMAESWDDRDLIRYNTKSHISLVAQTQNLSAKDKFPDYFCTFVGGNWQLPVPFTNPE